MFPEIRTTDHDVTQIMLALRAIYELLVRTQETLHAIERGQ